MPTAPNPVNIPRFREEKWHLLGLFAVIFAAYFYTMARTVTLEDSGLFIMSAHYLGIAHPPGYPLYTLLGKCFTSLLPLNNPALSVHCLSGFFGAGTAVLLFMISRCFLSQRIISYALALAFAFSRTFWSQAIIAEVYTLNTFLFFLLVLLALIYRFEQHRIALYLLALVYGLSLTNHWPLIILSTPCLLLLLAPCWKKLITAWPAIPLLLLGLTPYLWMYFRSKANPFISFYGPLNTFDEFWYYISRQGYSDAGAGAGLSDVLELCGFAARQMGIQFSLLGAVLAAIGAWRINKQVPASFAWSLVLGFLGSSFILIAINPVNVTALNQAVFQVYPLIPYGIMALWIGMGLQETLNALTRFWPGALKPMTPSLCALAVLLPLVLNASHNQKRHETWAYDYARTLLETLPPKAVLITHSDFDAATIGYVRYVENFRSDVAVYNDNGFVFANRFYSPREHEETKKARLRAAFGNTPRPIFLTDLHKNPTRKTAEEKFGIESFGLYKKINKAAKSGVWSYPFQPGVAAYFDHIDAMEKPTDYFTEYHREGLLNFFRTALIGASAQAGKAAWPENELRPRLEKATRSLPRKLELLNAHIFLKHTTPYTGDLDRWFKQAQALLTDATPVKQRAKFHKLYGVHLWQQNQWDEGYRQLEQSLSLLPGLEQNNAVYYLLQLYALQGNVKAYHQARKTHLKMPLPKKYVSKIATLDRTVRQAGKTAGPAK